MSFASRLDKSAKARRLSNQALADLLSDIGREGVRSWRKGVTQPTVDDILGLAEILGVSPEWLLTGREPEPGTLSEDESFVLDAYRKARERGLDATDVVLWLGGEVNRLPSEAGSRRVDPPAPAKQRRQP